MDFKNENIERQYRDRIRAIDLLVNGAVEPERYAWNATARQCAVRVEQIKNLFDDDIFAADRDKEITDISRDLTTFLSKCASPEYQVALVGTIKAGKSTLINALLNYELASTHITPETAALTKFKHADEDFVEVSFYTQKEWAELWKSATSTTNTVFVEEYEKLGAENEKPKWIDQPPQKMSFNNRAELRAEIERRTSSKSPQHYFVKEVVVGLKDFDLPDRVVLIDTPGLNDVVKFRSNITDQYIARANAVLMCVKSDKLEGGELLTLGRVFKNTHGKVEKVFVIATQTDTLPNPEDDWQAQQGEWTKYLKGADYFNGVNLVQSNLIPVSASLFSLLEKYRRGEFDGPRDKDYRAFRSILMKYGIFDESELGDQFARLEETTNIRRLLHILKTRIIAKYQEDLVDGIVRDYDHYAIQIKDVMERKRTSQEKLIADTQKDLEQIQAERAQKLQELNVIKESQEELSEFVKRLRIEMSEAVDTAMNEIRNAH